VDDASFLHRIHFGFLITFHYLFPQLTMGLAPLIVIFKALALRKTIEPRKAALYDDAARFWAKIFGINFVLGVVTGIPMEFQFGTNWARFASLSGGVIGQPLAMEGTFSFFLESAFLGLFLYGESRLSRRGHFWAAFLVFLGSWLSGFFIIATSAWMQHPVAYTRLPDGRYSVSSFWGLLFNPWALIQYAHNMSGAVVTGAFVMAAIGAFYLLARTHVEHARAFVRMGIVAGLVASLCQVFTGDLHGKYMAKHQPVTTAAMEALFKSERGAPMVILGQPDEERQRIDNPIVVNRVLSFLVYGTTTAEVRGLNAFPKEDWPTNIPLLYFSYHIMVGLGTIFIAVMIAAAFQLYRKRLFETRGLLWVLMLCAPLPYIANTAGWVTAEVGRQPWLIYGLMRTVNGYSHNVHPGNALFTLLGFAGLYSVLAIVFLFAVQRIVAQGPESREMPGAGAPLTESARAAGH
jgi:cytochrome d ubiquinol oxidase subunit I